jgi:hypothetical protein
LIVNLFFDEHARLEFARFWRLKVLNLAISFFDFCSPGCLGHCYLKGTTGDATNTILAAVGHGFRNVLAWLRILLYLILVALWRRLASQSALKLAC